MRIANSYLRTTIGLAAITVVLPVVVVVVGLLIFSAVLQLSSMTQTLVVALGGALVLQLASFWAKRIAARKNEVDGSPQASDLGDRGLDIFEAQTRMIKLESRIRALENNLANVTASISNASAGHPASEYGGTQDSKFIQNLPDPREAPNLTFLYVVDDATRDIVSTVGKDNYASILSVIDSFEAKYMHLVPKDDQPHVHYLLMDLLLHVNSMDPDSRDDQKLNEFVRNGLIDIFLFAQPLLAASERELR